jgi:hypothetical protein
MVSTLGHSWTTADFRPLAVKWPEAMATLQKLGGSYGGPMTEEALNAYVLPAIEKLRPQVSPEEIARQDAISEFHAAISRYASLALGILEEQRALERLADTSAYKLLNTITPPMLRKVRTAERLVADLCGISRPIWCRICPMPAPTATPRSRCSTKFSSSINLHAQIRDALSFHSLGSQHQHEQLIRALISEVFALKARIAELEKPSSKRRKRHG